MHTETKTESDIPKKNAYEEMKNLQNDFSLLKENINQETNFIEMNKEENLDLLDLNYNYIFNSSMEDHRIINNNLVDDSLKNNTNDIFCNIEEHDRLIDNRTNFKSEININNMVENSYDNIKNSIQNMNLSVECNSMNESKEEISENTKMKMKIKNLMKLVDILKLQINKKDEEIYKMEVDLKLIKEKNEEKYFSLDRTLEKSDNNLKKISDDNFINKLKSIIIPQNDSIIVLEKKLKEKSKEILFLTEENNAKDEKLEELKKEIEANYKHLREYKKFQKNLEMDVNYKIYNAENFLSTSNQKIKENKIKIKERDYNIEKQKRIINELNNELKKKEEKNCELRNIIGNIHLNNGRDLIKYKQYNMDLINRLSLSNSLMNKNKIEGEKTHMHYKELEEELKNKDNELKKKQKTLLAKDDIIKKMKHEINMLEFSLEIKNVNYINILKKIKTIKKECCLHLKKQKEYYLCFINKLCKEKDDIIKNHIDELSRLNNKYNEIVAENENMKNDVKNMNDEIVNKYKDIENMKDKLVDYESKLLVYEKNNDIQILKKNENHLREMLNKHIYKNEQLMNTNFLLQKSTLENNILEKKLIELKAKNYRKDKEIKKLLEKNRRKSIGIFSDSCNQEIEDIKVYKTKYNHANKENYISIGDNNNNIVEPHIENSIKITGIKESFNSFKDDPVYLALCEYFNFYKRSNNFNIKKIGIDTYMLNHKKVIIKFINGDLYVEDGAYTVKLEHYLLKNSK